MEPSDFITIPKSIINDWKFKDEAVFKFWFLLLVEETESQKDEAGLFPVKSLSKLAQKAGINRHKATRLLKQMESTGDLELLSSYYRGKEKKFWNMNNETTTKICITKNITLAQFCEQFSTDIKTSTKAVKADPGPDRVSNSAIMFPEEPDDFKYLRDDGDSRNESEHFDEQFSNDIKSPDRDLETESEAKNVSNFVSNFETTKKAPMTPDQEERIIRRSMFLLAMNKELQHTLHDATFHAEFNRIVKQYDGSDSESIQLAVRQEIYDFMFEHFGDGIEIVKTDLIRRYGPLHTETHPESEKQYDRFLSPKFMELSRTARIHMSEQKPIGVSIKGARSIGEVANQFVEQFDEQFSTDTRTFVKATKPDSNTENVRYSVINVPEKPENNPNEKASQVGTDIAIKYIRNNKIMESNILSTSTSTNKKNIYVLEEVNKRGYGGEKKEKRSCLDSQEKNNSDKQRTETSKSAENHPDGRPAFSTNAFKLLPRDEQIEIIKGRLGDFSDKFPTIDIEFEFERWADWLAAKGTKFKDYSAAFRNWLRNVLVYASTNNPKSPVRVYNTTGTKLVTKEVFTNPAHVPFKPEPKRRQAPLRSNTQL
jgi:hypothetical protein